MVKGPLIVHLDRKNQREPQLFFLKILLIK